MIEFRDVHKSFGARAVLRGFDLRVEPGEALFIIGTSGVGKSVAIKHVIGLHRVDAGEIWLGDQRIDPLSERELGPIRKRVGMVFQHATLFDSLTLAENVALPLRKHRGMRQREALVEARRRLDAVDLEPYADRAPAELGDGMRKRAAIARTLTLEPEVALLDEPTTGLDPVNARRIDALIRDLTRERGMTSIVVSHDLTSIFTVADRVAFLYQGRVYALGTPDEIRRSGDPVVEQFVSGRPSGPMETPGF